MAETKRRVLVLDADVVPCLTIVRSLGARGLSVDIAGSTEQPIAAYSKYAGTLVKYPDPMERPDDFVGFILEHLSHNAYDLIIPVTERTLVPLARARSGHDLLSSLASPPLEHLDHVLDKSKTLAMAEACGVPTPETHAVATLDELRTLVESVAYPVVLKPTHSIPGSEARARTQLAVGYAHDAKELLEAGARYLQHGGLLIQQLVPGLGIGINVLADHGEIVYAFQHQRLHELPLTGGGSCYRKSTDINPTLLEASVRLMAHLDWHGVAMVEFKYHPATQSYWLMEINGRFWGSLPLAVAAGADFPFMLYQLLVHERRPTLPKARTGVYCRRLSTDLSWHEQVLRRSEEADHVVYPSLREVLRDLLMALHPTRHFFDVLSIRDPRPGWNELRQTAVTNVRRVTNLAHRKRLEKKHASSDTRRTVIGRLRHTKRLLFVCYGNINRSALAHAALGKQLNSRPGIQIRSTGFHAADKRPADPTMVALAKDKGIDLSDWSSSSLTEEQLEWAEVIFVMEISQLAQIRKEHPAYADKTFLLGLLNFEKYGTVEIEDPYSRPREAYSACLHRVCDAVDIVANNLPSNPAIDAVRSVTVAGKGEGG